MKKLLGVCLVVLLAVPVVSSADAPPPFLLMWGSEGDAPGQFMSSVIGYVALDEHENVYVPGSESTAPWANRVQVFDPDGRFIRQFTSPYTASVMAGIAIDGQGDIVVTNKGCDRVEKYDNQGNFLRMWGWGVRDGYSGFQICTSGCLCGIAGGGTGQLNEPSGEVATDVDGNVYVVDRGNNRIVKYDILGQFLMTWGYGVISGTDDFQICTSNCQAGVAGSGNGQFDLPTGIDVVGDTVYVSEWNNNGRVQLFSRGGIYQTQYPAGYSASGVSVSPDGDIYVALSWGYEVLKLDSSGTQVASWGANGGGIGEFDRPHGLAVAPSGNVYVVDKSNSRIQKFGPALRSFKAGLQARTKPLVVYPE